MQKTGKGERYVLFLSGLLYFIFLSFYGSTVLGQENIKPLQIGDTIPDALWNLPIQVINHPKGKETVTLKDYRNKKLIILDFWATWCGSCIGALPKLAALSKDYEDDVWVLPITRQTHDKVQEFLQKRGKDFRESFTYLVDASAVKPYFPHTYIPHVVVLSQGRVCHIETNAPMDEVWITEMLVDEKGGQDAFSL